MATPTTDRYILTENHPAYGRIGLLISKDRHGKIQWFDRALFIPAGNESDYDYKVTATIKGHETNSVYLLTDNTIIKFMKNFNDLTAERLLKKLKEPKENVAISQQGIEFKFEKL